MANLIMFTALLLLVVMPYGVFAQSSTNVSVISVSPLPTTIFTAVTTPAQSPVGQLTTTAAAQPTPTITVVLPSNPTVLPTPSNPTVLPTPSNPTVLPTPSNPTVLPTPSNPTVLPTPSNPTTKSTAITTGSSVKPTTSACPVPRTISFLNKTRKDLDNKIVDLTVNYPDKELSCTKNDDCCKGNRATDVILTFENCPQYIFKNFTCVDVVGVCQCRAGFLSASFLLTIVGMIFFFIN